jgi:hypothetical protein
MIYYENNVGLTQTGYKTSAKKCRYTSQMQPIAVIMNGLLKQSSRPDIIAKQT